MLKKIIDWTKRWSFLILIVTVGVGYLTVYDYWQVYAAPLHTLQEWLNKAMMPTLKEEAVSGGDIQVSTGDVISSGDLAVDLDGSVSAGNVQADSVPGISDVNQSEDIVEENPTVSGSDIIKEVVYQSVEDDYFQDAVFIGDSRTVGLHEYGGLEEISTFYASTGLTVYKIFDAPIVEVEGQKQKITVEQALSENRFSKIYLMIGINEMGTGTVDSFMEKYSQAVEHLRKLQPDATIYLQGIMKVTTERSEKGDYITNEGIEERNARIAELADNDGIYYLDVNPMLCDDTGGMEASYTFDGVHLKAQYISIWKDYLKNHAVE